MTAFRTILERAQKRAGGAEGLKAQLPEPRSDDELRAESDDRYLSLMSLRAFRAGLRHALVDAKWPAFEDVFFGFAPRRITAMNDEDLERLMGDRRLIRHWGKIKAVRHNAAAMLSVADAYGGFGSYLAGWPSAEIVRLWDEIAKRFSQMGGNSGPYFLRMAGKDTFLLTGDVVRALVDYGVIGDKPSSKRDRAVVEEAFNRWAEESGRPLCQISKILALAVG